MRWLVSCPSVSLMTNGKLGAGVGVSLGMGVGVGGSGGVGVEGTGEDVGLGVSVGTRVAVSLGKGVAVWVGLGVRVAPGEGVRLGKAANLRVGLAVGVAVTTGSFMVSHKVRPEPKAVKSMTIQNPASKTVLRVKIQMDRFLFNVVRSSQAKC